MNQLVDLQFAYKVSKSKPITLGIENFLNECVRENKEEVIKAISRLTEYQPDFIIETFAFEILSGMFAQKTQKELLDIIKGGSLFKIKDKLITAFYNDTDIQATIRG
ncbi:hypothetical protein ABC255_08620 [Neobacillus sp. 3P2-tot-E-2]|uniref:hypothetical protein n=1 Tax=Neobacillus sp. 3P2-tot-E-2 TaxID=3132212 RepID=UPI0039A3E054